MSTVTPDHELRDFALAKFAREFRAKFDAGTREHNADGTRGLARMTLPQLVAAAHEEVYDLHAYLCAIEHVFTAEQTANEMKQNNKQ